MLLKASQGVSWGEVGRGGEEGKLESGDSTGVALGQLPKIYTLLYLDYV